MASPSLPTAAVHGPYEDLAIAIVQMITEIIKGQPPEIRAQLWQGYLDDMKAWRAFWGIGVK